eukprot:sb/3472995/
MWATPPPPRVYKQEPTETSKQPIRTRYLDHVTGYQPISDQYFLIRSVHFDHEKQQRTSSETPRSISLSLSHVLYSCEDEPNILGIRGLRVMGVDEAPTLSTLLFLPRSSFLPSVAISVQSDPDLVTPDLVTPRFSDRINFPRYRKLMVFDPDLVATPI